MSRKTRKLMWSVPLIAAVAVIGALAAFMTLTPNDAAAQGTGQPPGQPLNLVAAADTEGIPQEEIELTWNLPDTGGPPTHYRIDVSMNGGNTWVALESRFNGTRYFHDDLSASTTYHYRVFAINPRGTSPVSDIVYEMTAASNLPEAPTGLTAVLGTPNPNDTPTVADTIEELTAMLSWNAPDNPPGAPVTQYMVEYSTDGGRSWQAIPLAKALKGKLTATSVNHLGNPDGKNDHEMALDAGIEYHYRVAAVNSVGQGPWSATPNPSVETLDADTPDIEGGLRVGLSPQVATVWLYWDKPSDPMGDPVTGYEVQGQPYIDTDATTDGIQLETGIDNNWQTVKDNIDVPRGKYIHSFQVTERDVDANTTYDAHFTPNVAWAFRVVAKNRAGAGAWTIPDLDPAPGDAVLTDINAPARGERTTPLRPGSLTITRSTDDSHQSGRTGLKLTWDKSTAQKGTEADPPVDIDAGTYRIEFSATGPAEGGYNWRQLDADGALEVDSDGNPTTVGVYTPSDPPATADVQMFTDGYLETNETANHPFVLKGGQTRYYRVFANLTTAGNTEMSWPSVQKSGTTARPLQPMKPTSFTATATGHTSIKLAWAAPTTDTSSGWDEVIDNYIVQVWDADRSRWNDLDTTDKTEYDHTGLKPEQTVKYRVAAVNSASSRARYEWSDEMEETTIPALLPNEPGGLTAEAYGYNAIKLCWNAQAVQPLDAPVEKYVIEYSPDGKDGTWKMLAEVTDMTDDDVHTIYMDTMDLEAGETRHYRVTAHNVQGQSDQSDVAMATTMAATVPGMPMALTATPVSDMQIDLMWDDPDSSGGSDIIGYVLERKSGDGEFMTIAATDAAAWWNALNCEMMNAAIPDDADPAPPADHTAMGAPYCVLYADLAEDAMMVVSQAFDDSGYATITGTSHMDMMGLMEMTGYTYQVKAVNAKGASMPSDSDMAMTLRTNVAPVAGEALMATVTAGETEMVQSVFTDADEEDATLTYSSPAMSSDSTVATATVDDMGMVTIMGVSAGTATITVTASDSMGASASQEIVVTVEAAVVAPTNNAPMAGADIADQTVTAGMTVMVQSTITDSDADDTLTWTSPAMSSDDTVATATVDNMGMVTITGVSHGEATITVTATDMAGASASQTIMVTVEAVRMAPTTVTVNPVGSGLVNVEWTPVPGAAGYYIIAAENVIGGTVHSEAVNGGDSNLGSVGGLMKDVEYQIYIGAFFTIDDYVLRYVETVTAE